jgi:hypothetical protein
MHEGFSENAPKALAYCRICTKDIAAKEPSILFETYAAGKYLRLFMHKQCFSSQVKGIL